MGKKLKTTAGTQAILDLEDANPEVLQATVAGSSTPFWLQVRMEFAAAMAESELSSIALPTRIGKAQVIRRIVRSHLPSRRDAVRFPARRELLFLVGGLTRHVSASASHNWLVDEFASEFEGRAVVAQRLPLIGPPPAFVETRTLDLAEGRVDVLTRLRPASAPALREVDRLVAEFSTLLDMGLSADRVSAISAAAQYQESRRAHLEQEYERMLDRVQPRVVVMEDASYGSRAPFIALMKRRGIQVLEPQHGWIGPSHAAYNYGEVAGSEDFRAGLPDVLLTFGEYWNQGIRYPSRTVAIGKPHMDAMSSDLPDFASRPREILVISSVADPEETSHLTLQLRDLLPEDWEVVFRPHPSERQDLETRYPRLVGEARIRFDENLDVYDSLRRCRGAIGVASTVLYEAVAMGCHIFVRDSTLASFMADPLVGEQFRGVSELGRVVSTVMGAEPRSGDSVDLLWKRQAAGNFATLLGSLLEDR